MKYKVGKSQIHGDGVFAIKSYKKGERISTEPDYVNDTNQTIASSFHNHNDKDSNILNVKKGNKRFLIAKRGIEVGEELTANYNLTPSPPYEDPNNFKDLDERELPLSDEEAQAMIDGGFELEELHEGGEPGHTHDPPSYEDAMQAYKDSIAAKEAYEEEYKKKEKDYSKLKAKYDKYNKTYLNNKKMWGLIDSIDPESNPYVDIDTFPSFNQGPNAYKLYQNLPSDIKEQLDFPEFDKRDIGQRFNTSVLPEGVTADSDYYSEGAGASGLIDLNHLHRSDLSFRYPKDNPKYKPDLSHLAYPTTTNWNHNFSTPDLKENFPIASVYDIHSDRFKNITDKDVKVINFYADRNSDLDFYNREILKLLQDSGLDLTGMTTNASQSEQQIINRLIKLQEPDKIGSLEYNPPEVLERPNFADYVDPMPVIKPELIVDTSLPEELIERDEVEGVDYERKFGMWLDDKAQKDAKLKTFFKYKVPEFFNDKPSRTSQYYRTPKKIRSGFYNKPIEEEQLYPEGFAPRFHEGGTPHSHLHDPLLEEQDGGPVVKQRRGVRENSDGSVSSHLMRAEYIPERGWVGFPSLFQDSKPYADDQQNWVDMSETPDEDWMKIYEEAERRGEVYDFGEDKEAALAFGMGSWKDQLPDEGMEVELSDEEADKYRAGGYVLEEMQEPELPKANGGGPSKFLANKVAPVVIEPAIKLIETFFPGIGRSAGAKISRLSQGDARYNYKDLIEDVFKKGNSDKYFGQEGTILPEWNIGHFMGPDALAKSKAINEYYGEDNRDLVRQYFFGDSNNMTETAWKSHLEGDNPLGDMIKRHGPLKAFRMFSEIGEGKPLNAYDLAEQMQIRRENSLRAFDRPLYDSKTFRDATGWNPNSGHTPIDEPNAFLDNKQGLVDIYEDQFKRFGTDVLPFDVNPAATNSMGEPVKSPSRALSYNPIKPYDDIAGHMTYLQRHGQGDYSLTSRDAWHFSPKSYNSKWYDKEGYLENLPARLMDKFGKPFVLTQTNPISFDFDLFKNPGKSKLKLKRGGLIRYDNGGGIDSKLKVTNTFDKEKVDELRTRHEKFENENSDVKKVSFEEWLNYQLMDQRSNDNPDAKRKFTDYMVINEDGSASVYDGEELKNRMWQHGRKMEQLVGAGLPEGDHLFLQEHITKATADGEIRYMNHIKKGLREGMTMTEIKNDMLKNKLISKKGWNKKYEGKTVDHINTEYEKVQGTIKEFDNKFKVMQTNLGSQIDPDLMDIKQLQMDPQSAYDYVKQEPEPEVKYQRIAGTAHTQQIPSMEGVSIPNLANESTVSSGEALYNKTMNPAGLPLTAASKNWQSLKENEKQNWNVKSTFADINNKSAAYKKTANEYVGNAANQMYNQNIQSDFDNNQLDPNGRYIGEGNPPFVFAGGADEIDPLDYVPWTEKEIANNELNNKTQLLNSMYNRDFTNEDFVSQVTQKFSPENYVTTGKDDFGREILKKADYNSNSTIGAQRRAQDAITNSGYNSTMQHSGRTGWVDPVKWIMGPGAGVAGLGKNLVTKSLKGLSNSLRTSPVNWASKNLLGKELPGWLNYATTPGKIIGADFAYNSFKPDGLVPNLAEGIQKVYQGNDDGKKQIVDNAFGALWGVPAFKGIRGAQNLIKNIKGTNSLMPAAKNSRFGNYGFGYTSPSGNTNILRANPDYTVGDKIKNFKPSFDINMPGIGRFQGAKYTEPTATGYSRATKDPFGFSKNFSLNTSGTPSTSTSGSKFSNNNYLLGNSKLNNSFNSFSDTNPDGWKPTDTDPDFQSTFNKSVANTERQKIADINNVIVDQTKQEVSDLSSPEGIRRLTLNYKNLNPNLNEEELNHLVTTTINEVNEAGTQNVASYLAEDASFENMGAGEAISEIDKAIPKGNAYFTGNPFYGDKLRGDVPSRQKGFGLDAFKRFGSDESEILGNLGESMKSGNIPTVGTSWGKPIKRLDLWSGALSSQNPIFTPGSITTGSDLADNPTIGHELGHAIARSGVTDTDIKLQQLFTDAGVKGFGQRNWNKKVIKNNPDSAETLEAGQNYFYNPGYGNQAMSPTNKKYYDMPIEGFPMAREFRQDMIDKGLLQSKYDKITPSILESYGLSNTPSLENRAFYMSPPSKYGPFSDILNDMPSWLAPTIGTGVGVGIGLNSQKEEKDVKLKKGGFIDLKLTEKEALAYARNGYVLEVIN